MDEKEVSSGGGSAGNELEDNKKKREKAPKGGVQSLNASPRRGFSPRFGPPPENHHQAKKKKKGKKARDGDGDGDDNIEEGGSRVRDRSKSLDYSAMSEISSRLQEDKKEKKENKKKNNSKGATATREGRSATTLEAPGPSKLNSSKSRSSSVRNALTCFIPSSKESPATDETMIDKKKMGDMITLAAEAEDDDGGSGKRKKKKAGKSGSTSSSSSSSSSLSLPASPTRAPTVHHHRLSGGMAFGDDQRGRGTAAKKHRRNLSALEDLQYNNVVVVATNNGTAAPMAIPTSSSSPTLDSRPSKKNTLSPHMRSSSDRFSYNSKHNKEKLKTTKGGGRPNERNSNELADRRSSGLAKESRTGNRHRSSSSSSASSSSSSSSSGDEGSGHKKKNNNKKKEKKNKKKDKQRQHQQHQQQLGSPNSKVMTASMSWRAKKTSQSDSATPAPGPGTQIIISPRKPAPAFPKSKQRLSFSGWLTHFNVQLNPGAAENGPKRKYKEGTVEGFLEDIQLDEHVNELVKVRGIASMERLFEVTTQQFYDMDIPTSDLRLLIEEIGKRKNPPAVESPTPQGDKPATPRQKTPLAHNNSAQPDTTTAGGEEAAATETKRKRRSTRSEKRRLEKEADDAAVLQALEQRLGEEADRRARAEQERDEALRALEAERQRAGDVERKLAEALARIQALEQSLAAAQAATAESAKKKTKAPKKTKAKAKAKKEKETPRRKTPRAAAAADGAKQDAGVESVAKGEHDDVSKAKEATATTSAPGETAEKAHGEGDRDAPEAPAEGDGEGEGLIQYHYPLPIRVPSGRVNRLSTRLSLKAKSPASPRGASPRTVVNTNSSEGRMRQAEKETFEQKQNDIRHWIEEATKESFPSADFFKSLRSGVLLCKLLNVISPGIVKEVHVGDMVFYQMENITYFVQGCRKLGVKTVFEPADLYHGKNLEAVLSCLDALDRWSRRSTTYKGPFLVRSTSHSQFIRSLSGKLMLDKDVITAKKDSSSEIRPPTPVVAAANPN